MVSVVGDKRRRLEIIEKAFRGFLSVLKMILLLKLQREGENDDCKSFEEGMWLFFKRLGVKQFFVSEMRSTQKLKTVGIAARFLLQIFFPFR